MSGTSRERRSGRRPREPRAPSSPGTAARARPARRRYRAPAAVIVAACGVLIVAVIAWAMWPRDRAPSAPAPMADPLDAMPPGVAYDSALVLVTSDHTAQSLPLYRRALRGVQEDFWQLHSNYGSALYNHTLQTMVRRGVRIGRTRSAFERAALIRESIAESERARALAPSPPERATVLELMGQMAHVYGLPWETFVAYREAQFANPADPALRRRADQLQSNLEHPTAAITIRSGTEEAGIER